MVWNRKEETTLQKVRVILFNLIQQSMKNLLLKLVERVSPNINNLGAEKLKLQEQLHQASEKRDWKEAERLGKELLKVNRSIESCK